MDDKRDVPSLGQPDLLSVPKEVFGDLLRLRRVCGQLKDFSDDFIRNKFKNKVREINETNYPFKYFLQANPPTTSIFLNNCFPAFFEDPDIPEFLRVYGAQITHVTICHFDSFNTPAELHFFSSLPNLVYLDIDFIDAKKRDCESTRRNTAKVFQVPREIYPFPENFKNLKTLKLNRVNGIVWFGDDFAWDLIEFCDQLEYLKHPLFEEGAPSDPFSCVLNHQNRQFYDLEHENSDNEEDEHDSIGNDFWGLLTMCSERNVKLLNVNSANFRNCNMDWNPLSSAMASQLVSLRNVHGTHFLVESPNLEKLVIESTLDSSYADVWPFGEVRPIEVPQWPKLKVLDLTINSRKMRGAETIGEADTDELLGFLFGAGKKREKVTELAIRYSDWMCRECDREAIPIPRVRDVTGVCPFLTKLTLANWLGSNEQVTYFWKGLPLLEEVELDECKTLEDLAFIGEQVEDPDFLKLKKLKKVSLKRLDKMPKVTGLIFDLVFRHLKIKQFCLTSETPLKSVTVPGIESLLNGEFNNSVERFLFDGWSLDGISDEAFLELKLKFRASHMI